MKVQIRAFQEEDVQSILEIINYNILNSTALYDYVPRTIAQQTAIFKDKTEKQREEDTQQIELLRIAVASLKIREKELIAYVTLVEKEVQILRELLILQGAATPESSLQIENLKVLDSETVSFVEQIVKNHPKT